MESEQDTTLRKAISSRMKLQGFKEENKNPSLLVTYKVFYDDFSFQGYQQPELEQWIRYEDDGMEYDPVKYSLRQGDLINHIPGSEKRDCSLAGLRFQSFWKPAIRQRQVS